MSETSPGFNVDYEIVPGANHVRRVAGFVKGVLRAGSETELCLSTHRRESPLDEPVEPVTSLTCDGYETDEFLQGRVKYE